ncbi:MAG: DUF1631 family protein, partial [Gammaproteobacteria bacterium]|nr:DUF1631 family protein [Gammaproteobacteria bacterium]
RRRSHNEDAVWVDVQSALMLVADGVGGHNAGEVASAITVQIMSEQLNSALDTRPVGDSTADLAAINALFWDDVKDEAPDPDALSRLGVVEHGAGDELDELDALDGDEPGSGDAAGCGAPVDESGDAFLAAVKTFRVGLWVEFGCDEAAAHRARLTWVSARRDKFLFTDRLGAKVAESSAHGLALELRMGRVRVLDSVPLFYRTISGITARLRRNERLSQAAPEALESTA